MVPPHTHSKRARHSFAVRVPPVGNSQRIGLLGGSFNPAHEAHRLISDIALKRLRLDQVWWIVTPGNPLKPHHDLQPLAERMRVARGIAASPRIVVTSFEAELGSAYTVDTLAFLTRRFSRVHFVWLMGADNLVQMPRWRHWRRIFSLLPVAVVDRPGWHLRAISTAAAQRHARHSLVESRAAALPTRRPPAWVFLTGPLSKQSSTAIRAARRHGR